MKVSSRLRDAIATQFTLAINAHIPGSGVNVTECFEKTIALIECADMTADTAPTEPFPAPSKRALVELAAVPGLKTF